VTYNQGCIATATVKVNVSGEPPLYIPNAFSPNGDGTNDVLYAYGEGIKTLKMTVFDRWGEKVFESDDQSAGWDGTFRGVLQSPGVYIYLVDVVYLNDQTRHRQGSVTLIR
jgi:gliding motility-associated-like protein